MRKRDGEMNRSQNPHLSPMDSEPHRRPSTTHSRPHYRRVSSPPAPDTINLRRRRWTTVPARTHSDAPPSSVASLLGHEHQHRRSFRPARRHAQPFVALHALP
ncbi:hypothetical protein U1Q18_023806 [Sarracenia purpurea var. burkii]